MDNDEAGTVEGLPDLRHRAAARRQEQTVQRTDAFARDGAMTLPDPLAAIRARAQQATAFLRKKRAATEDQRLGRIHEAASWRSGTDADHEAARELGSRLGGRELPPMSAAARERT